MAKTKKLGDSAQTYQVEVVLSTQEDGLWRAEVPALPGCFADEETIEQALEDIQEGIRLFIASYRNAGDPLPPELEAVKPDFSYTLRLAVSVP